MMNAHSVSNPDAPDLPPLPSRLVGRPFGRDENGRPLNRTKGHVIRSTLEYMLECVGQRAVQSIPPETNPQEHAAHVAQAKKEAAFEQLSERINAAIPDPRYHATRDYLLNEGNTYKADLRELTTAYPAPKLQPESQLPPLPMYMENLPFGTDKAGRPVKQVQGSSVIASIEHMQEYISQRVEQELPIEASPSSRCKVARRWSIRHRGIQKPHSRGEST